MRVNRYVKSLTWEEGDRDSVVLGPGTRLDPLAHVAKLGTYSSDEYPTDVDLFVKSRLANPRRLVQWLGFEATVRHQEVDGAVATSVGFRLSDGVSQRRWDGSTWAVSASGWNTEEEVAAHIPDFPVSTKKLQVVVNLKTSDKSVTPELEEVKLLFSAVIDSEIEDLVERSLIPGLRAGLRPITRVSLVKSGSDNSLNLAADYKIDTDYRFVGVDSVFNHTDDPEHTTDLYESHTTRLTPGDPWHDGTVGVITLNTLVGDGKTIWARLVYEPAVSVETSRDYYELAHLPALTIETLTYEGRQLPGEDHVGNKGDGTAVVVPAPRQGPLDLTMACVADKLFDLNAMSAELAKFFGRRPELVSTGLDESYRLRLIGVMDFRAASNDNDLHSWRASARIEDFRVWDSDSRDDFLVKTFKVRGTLSTDVG